MSIVLAATSASVSPGTNAQVASTAAIATAIAAVLLWAAGVFRLHSAYGPERLPDAPAARKAALVFLITLLIWFGIQIVLVSVSGLGPDGLRSADGVTAMALLATFPPLVGILAMFAFGVQFDDRLPRHIGFTFDNLRSGIVRGAIGFVVVVPLVYATTLWAELTYRWIGYEHPTAHQLLQSMDAATPATRLMMTLGAVVMVPLFEEVLFRGHLQSVLRRFTGMPWLAMVVTSLVFAGLHEPWTAPIIFVLSVGLGYAYERTGILWVPIAMHVLFNLTQTALYLAGAAD